MFLASISEAIQAYQSGRMVIVVDDEDRENEGDLCLPAQHTTPAAIAFMARYGRGLVCVPMLGEHLDRLQLPLISHCRSEELRPKDAPNFTLSVDLRLGISSGISAADRAATILRLIDPKAGAEDFTCPGHVFPLRYADGGVLVRGGQTEASVDLAVLAGLTPAAVICEVMNDDGTMARLPELSVLSRRFDIPIVSVEQIVEHRNSGVWPLGERLPMAAAARV